MHGLCTVLCKVKMCMLYVPYVPCCMYKSLKVEYVHKHTTLGFDKKVQIQGGASPCQSGNPQPLQVTIHHLQETLYALHSLHNPYIVILFAGKLFISLVSEVFMECSYLAKMYMGMRHDYGSSCSHTGS